MPGGEPYQGNRIFAHGARQHAQHTASGHASRETGHEDTSKGAASALLLCFILTFCVHDSVFPCNLSSRSIDRGFVLQDGLDDVATDELKHHRRRVDQTFLKHGIEVATICPGGSLRRIGGTAY
jgi:hypothetical protein